MSRSQVVRWVGTRQVYGQVGNQVGNLGGRQVVGQVQEGKQLVRQELVIGFLDWQISLLVQFMSKYPGKQVDTRSQISGQVSNYGDRELGRQVQGARLLGRDVCRQLGSKVVRYLVSIYCIRRQLSSYRGRWVVRKLKSQKIRQVGRQIERQVCSQVVRQLEKGNRQVIVGQLDRKLGWQLQVVMQVEQGNRYLIK